MILFISHDAQRNGAPIVLIQLLKWLKNNTDIQFEILLRNGGELVSEFESIAQTYIMGNESFKHKVLRKIKLINNMSLELPVALNDKKYDLIYSNTITNGKLVSLLKNNAKKIMTHVHEMDSWIERSGEDNWHELIHQTTHFLAVSKPVINCLIQRGINKEAIRLLSGCASFTSAPSPEDRQSIRRALGISQGAFVVGGAGTEMWRKGRDLFLQLAVAIKREKRSRDFHFIWLGPHSPDAEFAMWLKHDAKITGCEKHIHWLGSVKKTESYYSAMDVFAMTSREDPMPLVAFEAGMMNLPVICFNSAGGTADWVKNEGGYSVPYLDISAMADKIILLSNDEKLLRRKGMNARSIVNSNYTVDVIGQKLADILFDELTTLSPSELL